MRTVLMFCLVGLLAGADAAAGGLDAAGLAALDPAIAALEPPAGAWSEAAVAKPADARSAIATAGARYLAAVKAAAGAPDANGQQALAQFIDVVATARRGERADALDPAYARRAVRGGALRGYGADAAAGEVEAAVAAACAVRPLRAFTGPGNARIEERRDAYGVGGYVLTSSTGVRYVRRHEDPHMLPGELPRLLLRVDLPPGTDVLTDAGKAAAVASLSAGKVVARWTAADGLRAEGWREVVREPRGRGMAPGLLPPHIAVTDLRGDLVCLITERGRLDGLRDGGAADAERFIADAARQLTDTARLDLIGQYVFNYTHDSPDPRFPALIGGDGATGDIHQTARQTLATAGGGQCRGDCDDLGELYQTVAERQGRMGHMLILPKHTAFAAAKKTGDGWTVELMQTGPTYAFTGPTLPDALRSTWTFFDATAPFSPDHLGVLLRFSGENQRGRFGLGWRIFSDPAYAKTMIDVQRDWQYQTYARAITKMKRMIAGGDRDPANLNELAALYQTTGQWPLAIDLQRQTLAAAKDPASIMEMRQDLIGQLRRAGRNDDARKELALAVEQFRAEADKLGPGAPQAAMSLAMSMLACGDEAQARALFVDRVMAPLSQLIGQFATGVQRGALTPARWQSDSRLVAVQRLIGTFVGVQVAMLDRVGRKPVGGGPTTAAAADPTLLAMRRNLDVWAARLAFLSPDTPAENLPIYGMIAGIHALDGGWAALDAEVDKAVRPTGKRDHLARPIAMAEARAADVAWIALSPGYWLQRQARALGARGGEEDDGGGPLDPAKADRTRAIAAGRAGLAAYKEALALGMDSEQVETMAHMLAINTAVLAGDSGLLRERLRFVASRKDKQLYESAAMALGRLAPYCDAAAWNAVLAAWADVVDYRPKWFLIAWTAAISGAKTQALATARMAATRFKDEPAFAEEAGFMAEVLK